MTQDHVWRLLPLGARQVSLLALCCRQAPLPAVQSGVWELLFHSNKHGQSFNTFMGHVGKTTARQLCCSLVALQLLSPGCMVF